MGLVFEGLFFRVLGETAFFGGIFFILFLAAFTFLTGEGLLSIQLGALFVVSYALTILVRLVYFRERPNKTRYTNLIERLDASSFPSLHSMRVSGIFLLFYNNYGDVLISAMFLCIALSVFSSRYFLKKHHLSDIVAGAAIGILIAYFVISLEFLVDLALVAQTLLAL